MLWVSVCVCAMMSHRISFESILRAARGLSGYYRLHCFFSKLRLYACGCPVFKFYFTPIYFSLSYFFFFDIYIFFIIKSKSLYVCHNLVLKVGNIIFVAHKAIVKKQSPCQMCVPDKHSTILSCFLSFSRRQNKMFQGRSFCVWQSGKERK